MEVVCLQFESYHMFIFLFNWMPEKLPGRLKYREGGSGSIVLYHSDRNVTKLFNLISY